LLQLMKARADKRRKRDRGTKKGRNSNFVQGRDKSAHRGPRTVHLLTPRSSDLSLLGDMRGERNNEELWGGESEEIVGRHLRQQIIQTETARRP